MPWIGVIQKILTCSTHLYTMLIWSFIRVDPPALGATRMDYVRFYGVSELVLHVTLVSVGLDFMCFLEIHYLS